MKTMIWYEAIILGVILLIAGCSHVEGRAGRIIGGDSVLIEHYPYQVSLRNSYGAHYCGGSIISEKHILTAAHCIDSNDKHASKNFHNVHVVTGSSYAMESARNKHGISKVQIHPGWIPFITDYNSKDYKDFPPPNDIAVITLKDNIVFDKKQQKIDLPTHDFEEGHLANFTGWGLISQEPWTFPNQLQMIATKLLSREDCQKKILAPDIIIYDTHVCAFRSRGGGACYGDSGSPLAADGKLVGVASWVEGKYCESRSPDVYTNVYKYKDFIEKIMKNSK